MILIGQYDSSFVRRVGIALRLYRMPFEHRPWSVFSDAEKIRSFNPLTRVPTLVLDDGTSLFDTNLILGHLDTLAGPEHPLHPEGEARVQSLRVTALASGLADKAVSLFYELRLHDHVSPVWRDRCRRQITDTLAVLEADRAGREGPHWFGERIGHADIAAAASLRHVADSLPDVLRLGDYPALKAHAEAMEALPVFREISQPFVPPT